MSIQTTVTQAELVANQLADQSNQFASYASGLLTSGRPALGNQVAISASDIAAAIGPVGVAQLNLIVAAANNNNATQLAAALAAL